MSAHAVHGQPRQTRQVDPAAAEEFLHLGEATNSGRVRPTLTVFAADRPERPGPWIWNEQLIRYAGYRQPDGTVVGDPRYADFTDRVRDLGWPGGPGPPFDVLPLVVQSPGEPLPHGLGELRVLEAPGQLVRGGLLETLLDPPDVPEWVAHAPDPIAPGQFGQPGHRGGAGRTGVNGD